MKMAVCAILFVVGVIMAMVAVGRHSAAHGTTAAVLIVGALLYQILSEISDKLRKGQK